MRVVVVSLLASVLFAVPLGQAPAFDAASVKRNTSGSENGARNLGAGGPLVFTNMTLPTIIAAAYEIEDFQVTGGSWMASERFDIVAVAGAPLPLPQLNERLRTLLADRFKLAVHTEEREQQSYVLERARDDGQLGARDRRLRTDWAGNWPRTARRLQRVARSGHHQLHRAADVAARARARQDAARDRRRPDRPHWRLRLRADVRARRAARPARADAPKPASDDPNAPTLFAALRGQLGFRLESRRTMVPFVVIDSASLPTAD
jgi:uncharacterized protein (TIGR03435 family)